MVVETFEVAEVNEHPECEGEALKLIEELGLDRQKSFRVGDKAERMPYRQITATERTVFQALCPVETELAKYGIDPIPLRVLQVAAHANPMFESLVVWHPETGADKDPVLLGKRKQANNSWAHDYFILARWGLELDEMPALIKQAMPVLRLKAEQAFNEVEAKIRAGRELLSMCESIEKIGSFSPYLSGVPGL